jgi:integrase
MVAKKAKLATPRATQHEVLAMFIRRRNNIFQFRRRVPDALRVVIGKREIVKSLKTTDSAIALSRAAQWMKDTEQMFDKARAQSIAVTVADFTAEEISRFCAWYIYLRVLEIDELKRTAQADSRIALYSMTLESLEEREKAWKRAYAIGDFSVLDTVLPAFLREQGLLLSKNFNRASFEQLQVAFLKANVTLVNHEKEIAAGEPVELPEPPAAPVAKAVCTISDAVALWSTDPNRNKKTVQEVARLADEFSSFYSGDLATLSKQKVYQFFQGKQALCRTTISKQAALLGAVCSLAVEQELLLANPFARLKIRTGKRSLPREGFTLSEIKAVFECRRINEDPELLMVSLLALITGARIEEICQLTHKDFRQDRHIYYISINCFDEKELKNTNSFRSVPIHPLFVQPVKEYVSQRKGNVFSFKPDKFGNLSASPSKRFNRVLRDVLQLPKSKTFHSFRHTFKTLCREKEIGNDVADAITGHVIGGDGAEYGLYSLNALYAAIEKLEFE